MSNMSHCRFHNTSIDFQDCVDALDELDFGDSEALSRDETSAAQRLIEAARDLVIAIAETNAVSVEDLEDEHIQEWLADLNAAADDRIAMEDEMEGREE